MTSIRKQFALLALIVGATLMPAASAQADRGHGGFGAHFHGGGGYHAGGGHWDHGHHGGGWGWWWVLPGAWLMYEQSAYPAYPPEVVQPAPPDAVVVEPAPVQPTWYFCDSAGTYYPYIQHCPEAWRAVPATPPPGTPANPAHAQ